MKDEQALQLINEKLKAFTFHKFGEPAYFKKYLQSLVKQPFTIMYKAIDMAYEQDGRNAPEISVLLELAQNMKRQDTSNNYTGIENEEYCPVCDNKGWVKYTERVENRKNEFLEYDYFPYCPYCKVGKSFSVNGESPITMYFDDLIIADIKKINLEKRSSAGSVPHDRFNQLLNRIGKRVSEVA